MYAVIFGGADQQTKALGRERREEGPSVKLDQCKRGVLG